MAPVVGYIASCQTDLQGLRKSWALLTGGPIVVRSLVRLDQSIFSISDCKLSSPRISLRTMARFSRGRRSAKLYNFITISSSGKIVNVADMWMRVVPPDCWRRTQQCVRTGLSPRRHLGSGKRTDWMVNSTPGPTRERAPVK